MSLLLVVDEDCFVRGIGSHKHGVPIGPSARAGNALHTWLCLQKYRFLSQRVGRKCAKRSDVVHDPHPAAMRGNYQSMIARVNCKIAHGNVWHFTALVLRPLLATIERNPKAQLRADEQKIFVNQIFFHYVRVTADRSALAD